MEPKIISRRKQGEQPAAITSLQKIKTLLVSVFTHQLPQGVFRRRADTNKSHLTRTTVPDSKGHVATSLRQHLSGPLPSLPDSACDQPPPFRPCSSTPATQPSPDPCLWPVERSLASAHHLDSLQQAVDKAQHLQNHAALEVRKASLYSHDSVAVFDITFHSRYKEHRFSTLRTFKGSTPAPRPACCTSIAYWVALMITYRGVSATT